MMKNNQKSKAATEPRVLLMREEKALSRGNGTAPYVQETQKQIREAEEQVREIVQESTAMLAEVFRHAVTITKRKDFRIRIDEEINVIERP